METKWLEDFICLARLRNFSRAAEERNVTQPAFSRRIRALERWLGTTLFDRRTYPVTLTPEGRSFHETAENVLTGLYRERAEFHDRQPSTFTDLRISAATTLCLNYIPGWLKSLEPELGPLTAQITTPNFHIMFDLLAEGDVDLVLQYTHSDAPIIFENALFDSVILSTERMILVSPTDPKTGRALYDPTQGDGPLPYMGYSGDGYFAKVEKTILAAIPDQSARIRRLSESPTSEFLKRMALEYKALALVPESCVRDEMHDGTLQQVGGESWSTMLNVHLFHSGVVARPLVRRLWQAVGGAPAV